MVEVCLESYFFKHVKTTEQEEVAAFRAIYPGTAVLGALAASLVLTIGSYGLLFTLLSMLMVYGVFVSFHLEE
jgi:hypothetical protein